MHTCILLMHVCTHVHSALPSSTDVLNHAFIVWPNTHSPRIQLKALIFIYRSYLGPALKYLCDTICQPIPLASCHLFNLWMALIFLSLVRGLSCFNPKPLLALALHSGMSSLLPPSDGSAILSRGLDATFLCLKSCHFSPRSIALGALQIRVHCKRYFRGPKIQYNMKSNIGI